MTGKLTEIHLDFGRWLMKNTLSKFNISASRINKNHLQFVLMIIVLTMLVLGAGAPEIVGGTGL